MFGKNKDKEAKKEIVQKVKVSKPKKVVEKDNTWLDPEAEIVVGEGE